MRTIKGSGKLLQCPKCGFSFDLTYARAFACATCPSSVSGCTMAKCPRCGNEFPV